MFPGPNTSSQGVWKPREATNINQQHNTCHLNLLSVGPLVWDYFNMHPWDDHAWGFAERLEIKRVQGKGSMHSFNYTR